MPRLTRRSVIFQSMMKASFYLEDNTKRKTYTILEVSFFYDTLNIFKLWLGTEKMLIDLFNFVDSGS